MTSQYYNLPKLEIKFRNPYLNLETSMVGLAFPNIELLGHINSLDLITRIEDLLV